jgi:drug/metabolite transporter (DMT)-like permease
MKLIVPKRYLGPALIILSQILFTASHTAVKALSEFFPTNQIMLARYILGPLVLAPLFIFGKVKLDLKNPLLLMIRVVAGITAMYLFFSGLRLGDIGKINLIFNLSIIWTIFFATIIFKERPSIKSLIAIPFAFFGLFLILKPTNLMAIGRGEIYTFIGSILLSIVFLSIKQLRKNHNSYSIVFMFYTFGSIIVGISTKFSFIMPTPFLLLLLVLTGLFGITAQLLMTKAYKYASASVASSATLSGIPLMFISGVLFFNETLDIASGIGLTITVISLLVIVRNQ